MIRNALQRGILALVVPLFFFPNPVLKAGDEVSAALNQIQEAKQLINIISRDALRLQKARLYLWAKSFEEVRLSIQMVGLSNLETLNKYFYLYDDLVHSVSFLQDVECPINHEAVARLIVIRDEIGKARGFDQRGEYYSRTLSAFTKLHGLFLQLSQETVLPEPLRAKMQALVAPLSVVIGHAKYWGDRRPIYAYSIPATRSVAELYPELNKIASSHAAYYTILEIQGVNEGYAEFAAIASQGPDEAKEPEAKK